MTLETRILAPTAKVFTDELPEAVPAKFTGLVGETVSFQLAYRAQDGGCVMSLEVRGTGAGQIRAKQVRLVPVEFATYEGTDDCYLRDKKPGLYPDALLDVRPHSLKSANRRWDSLWFDYKAEQAGDYSVQILLKNENTGEIVADVPVTIHVIAAELPEQKLIHTKWFHSDCLADYYHVEVFSEEYWRIVENFMRKAAERGINMILTPIHTPPLDTRVGSERTTVQLVDVYVRDGGYSFGFHRLHRWVELAKRCGMRYFEMAHLFTQWGAKHAPKIMAHTENGYERIFGWETEAAGKEYAEFLGAYLTALTAELEKMGIADVSYFHISDEPSRDHLDDYMAAKAIVTPYLKNYPIMDALSNFDFYRLGVVEHPVVAINDIEPFLAADVPNLWGYYCCGQCNKVTNLFISMPGARTRALAAQAYKFGLAGFLQWGWNFYNGQYSDYHIDPWAVTDADRSFPAGDPFQVYPNADGTPADSLRSMLFLEAMQDLRAMQLLESLAGREFVQKCVDEGLENPVRFDCCPYTDGYVLGLRDRINAEIEKRI